MFTIDCLPHIFRTFKVQFPFYFYFCLFFFWPTRDKKWVNQMKSKCIITRPWVRTKAQFAKAPFAMAYVGTLSPGHALLRSPAKHAPNPPTSIHIAVSTYAPLSSRKSRVAGRLRSVIRAESMTTEKLGIKIERKPSEDKLTQLGVRQWPK